ncbi:MAG: tryptophan synthase subunit alpha [Zymomonas mobilis subsp. pomaceae]|uniref:Tryptophan synthase alpha chain n=1 Tax=Zymomonas mobilis subsp. pomaceae (strain ATCC 29192 / DSM 22645 / JCM 10191 / CCUG 17912 / NBRC 13757 / NCIMB 11200 / NRRL B-4491 / Barker I) TaxID=579138 RepID=F8ERS9_ZYMMT|nr:tryptophan synthase subunit alpha [Zymomonas mobilis]AEI37537.1 tryptophan synthase, alpha subunit [Zymomonas mobilis subsp. pomaceae ATCC 29192]MDX5948905.1 tryptophan synthase subunit alpha [Zymomonas mobilis subsp. pomaceae]GEB88711.1 tryptophan synthase alpha chain [Zymomonas mobilis subsp. pomaceae]
MSRITDVFAKAKKDNRAALIAFITAGDPTPDKTPDLLDKLVENGVDIIELGMPFSDPMADGPAIQKANLRALAAKTSHDDIFAIAADFRKRHPNTPLILMGYANTMTFKGSDDFSSRAKKSGIDGVICVDIPPEEDATLGIDIRKYGLDMIRLATPTSDEKRLKTILHGATGFLYYVSVAGVTGLQQATEASITSAMDRIKAVTDLPVAVGFGIRTAEQAAAVAQKADAVVVGSAFVNKIEDAVRQNQDPAPALAQLAQMLSTAVCHARKEKVA